MANQFSVIPFRDMTGGLNLRADQFQLGPTETPDCWNVDFDPRGGVRMRRGYTPYDAGASTNAAGIHSIGQFHSGAYDHVLIGAGGQNYWSSGGAWAAVSTANASTLPNTYAQMLDALYIQNGTHQPVKWTGAVASRLGQTFNDNLAAPSTGNMPVGKVVAVHNGHTWVGNTLETAVRYPHRIRFSHPGKAECFRSFDYFDLDDGSDGDQIIAMVPLNDHLVVFKGKSIYAVYGYDADSFQVQNITREVGAVHNRAVAATPQGIYFFGWPTGLMLYDGKGLSWKFSKIIPAIDEGYILETRMNTEVTMGWVNNRVWVSVPWGSSGSRTFVYDPSLGKEGAWTKYNFGLGPIMVFSPEAQSRYPLSTIRNSTRLVRLETVDQHFDLMISAGTATHIDSYYRTPWFDNGEPAQRKRWKRPYFVFKGDTDALMTIKAYWDYDSADPKRTFSQASGPSSTNDQWDDVTVNWGPGAGVGQWGKARGDHVIERGASLGNSRAIQLLITGPTYDAINVHANSGWGLDSISFVFVPRKLR